MKRALLVLSASSRPYRRTENLAVPSRIAYRTILRAADAAAVECQLSNRDGLRLHVARKFRQAAQSNKQSNRPADKIRAQLTLVETYKDALGLAGGDAALTSILQVLAAGIGNEHYKREVEEGFVNLIHFREQQEARQELDEESTSERQVRIVQQATLPYVERLALLYRDDLTSAQLVDAFTSLRARVSTHHLHHGAEQVVLDVDDELNKQTIYIRCNEYDWSSPIERVEMCEPEMLRKTTLHAQYYSIALRLAEALEAETTLHRSRGTVIVGHGVGGAVATALAMILFANNYTVKNAISLGAPKVMVASLARVVDAISPLRFVIAGDPLVDVPVTDAVGDTFKHAGEIFVFECPVASKEESGDEEAPSSAASARSTGGDSDGEAARLMDLMNDDGSHTNEVSEDNEEQTTKSPKNSRPLDSSSVDDEVTASEAGTEDDDDDDRESEAAINSAGQRAAASRDPYLFSMQHYVDLMRDGSVAITYAEGDDVWDAGPSGGAPPKSYNPTRSS